MMNKIKWMNKRKEMTKKAEAEYITKTDWYFNRKCILSRPFCRCKSQGAMDMKARVIMCLLAFMMVAPLYGADNPQLQLMEQEIKYEKEKTEHIQNYILDKILGPGRGVAIVDIELGMETNVTRQAAQEKKTDAKKRLGEMEYLLPGVPNPKSVTNEASPGESKEETGQAARTTVDVRTVIKRQLVTILH